MSTIKRNHLGVSPPKGIHSEKRKFFNLVGAHSASHMLQTLTETELEELLHGGDRKRRAGLSPGSVVSTDFPTGSERADGARAPLAGRCGLCHKLCHCR